MDFVMTKSLKAFYSLRVNCYKTRKKWQPYTPVSAYFSAHTNCIIRFWRGKADSVQRYGRRVDWLLAYLTTNFKHWRKGYAVLYGRTTCEWWTAWNLERSKPTLFCGKTEEQMAYIRIDGHRLKFEPCTPRTRSRSDITRETKHGLAYITWHNTRSLQKL
jgi:hypothetical protein